MAAADYELLMACGWQIDEICRLWIVRRDHVDEAAEATLEAEAESRRALQETWAYITRRLFLEHLYATGRITEWPTRRATAGSQARQAA